VFVWRRQACLSPVWLMASGLGSLNIVLSIEVQPARIWTGAPVRVEMTAIELFEKLLGEWFMPVCDSVKHS
jgi:hypothetical protein